MQTIRYTYDMNIRDLKYLVAVAKHKHFGNAANECFVSQPALSMQLKKLEEELGVQIFERTNKNVMITQVGRKLIDKAKEVLQGADEMHDIAKNSHDPFAGEIKIGAFPTLAPYFLPQIVPQITKEFPKLKLLLLEEKTGTLIEKLKNGEIDAAFLATPLPVDDDSFEINELFQELFYLAVSQNHPFSKLKTVSEDDIKDEKLLLLQEGHCLRSQALDICSLMGASESQDFRATSLETLRQMVSANVGITLIPELAKKENDGIAYIPFKDAKPSRAIAMVSRKSSARKECFEAIIQTLNSTLNT